MLVIGTSAETCTTSNYWSLVSVLLVLVDPCQHELVTGESLPTWTCYRWIPANMNLLQVDPCQHELVTGESLPTWPCYRWIPANMNLLQVDPCQHKLVTGGSLPTWTCYRCQFKQLISAATTACSWSMQRRPNQFSSYVPNTRNGPGICSCSCQTSTTKSWMVTDPAITR